jgi:hypothetical protein
MNVKCFLCEKPIIVSEGYRMVPVEVPYGNVFFHVECVESVKQNNPDIYSYLNTRFNDLVPYFHGEIRKK